MTEDWSIIDTQGPPDAQPTSQAATYEESESLLPDASLELEGVQDVKP
jgi:hypothetical protein